LWILSAWNQRQLVIKYCYQGKALIELFNSISVLDKWPKNRLRG